MDMAGGTEGNYADEECSNHGIMGRNWKKKERVIPDIPIDLPLDYKWSSQSYTLQEILENFKLPVVVQCREETSAEHVKNFFFDLRQPILLHSRCTNRKVFARCVRKAAGGTVKELLPEVVIPEDYSGWFRISNGVDFVKPTPYRTVEELVNTHSEFFLCTTEFDALFLPDVGDDDEELEDEAFHRIIKEGEVLRKTGIQKLNQMLLPATFQQSAPDNRYLMCIDTCDRELFIPVLQTGLFYEVSDGSFDSNDAGVVQISDLLDEMVIFPLYVRHILGDPPPISKFYSPCLKLDRVKSEETVMGSTLEAEEEDFLPIEIQINSPIKFEIALNTPMLQNHIDYRDAVQLCNNIGDNYMADMKLAVTFKKLDEEQEDGESVETHVYSNPSFVGDEHETTSTVSNSQRTSLMSTMNGSEIGDVDANSEFNIQWDPGTESPQLNRRQPSDISAATDSASIASLGEENARKFNRLLGGNFIDTPLPVDGTTSQALNTRLMFQRDVDGTLKAERQGDVILRSNEGVEITPFVDIVEGITDFSVRPGFVKSESNPEINTSVYKTGYPCITVPTEAFARKQDSPRSSPTITSSSSQNSSSMSLTSGDRNEINLSDHFPGIQSSSNESISSISKHVKKRSPIKVSVCSDEEVLTDLTSNRNFTFTGDVFINHLTEDECQSETNNGSSAQTDWSNPYRVIRSKDLYKNRCLRKEEENVQLTGKYRHSSLTEELLKFTHHDDSHTPPDGIITCKVADEMMSSYNDLRICLEEVTKTAHDIHTENTWRAFCLERSSSLPVRSKSSPGKHVVNPEDHSQSWEQISPRRNDDSSTLTTSASGSSKTRNNTPRSLTKVKTKQVRKAPDKTFLLLDTSSEGSSRHSYRSDVSFASNGSADNSFSISDMSDNDGSVTGLRVIEEFHLGNESINVDGSVQNGNTLTRDKHILSKKMKVKQEIRRKKKADWSDNVSEI